MRSLRRRLAPLVAVIALVASACGGGAPEDPAQALVAALEQTGEERFAFDVSIDVSESALAEMGGAGAGMFLNTLSIGGSHVGDDVAFQIGAMGSTVFEIRAFDETDFFMQTGIAALLEGFGGGSADDLLAGLDQMGGDMPPIVNEVAEAFIGGDWVGFIDIDQERIEQAQQEMLGEQLEGEVDAEAMQNLFDDLRGRFSDAEGFISEWAIVTESEETEEGRVLAVELKLREFLLSMRDTINEFGAATGEDEIPLEEFEAEVESLPETIGGLTVTIDGERITRVVIDFADVANSVPDSEVSIASGDVQLIVDLDYDDVPDIDQPDATVELSTDDLIEIIEALSSLQPMMGTDPVPFPGDLDEGSESIDAAGPEEIDCSTVDGPCDYGDDPELDALWDACAAGDGEACDDLYFDAPFGSRYEAFGNTCGDRGTTDCSTI